MSTNTSTPTEREPLVLHFSPVLKIITPPTGGKSGLRNATLTAELKNWGKQDGTGLVFDSSTVFALPNGATRDKFQ